MTDWQIYRGTGEPHDGIDRLPPAPPWREFDGEPVLDPPRGGAFVPRRLGDQRRASAYRGHPDEVDMVNSALLLRRPLLVTGKPGTGKSTLAYAIAHELRLGPVLRWPITSRSTLLDGLYHYDAIRRVEDASLGQPLDIGRYLRLGPLGTALLPLRPPDSARLAEIVHAHLGPEAAARSTELIHRFLDRAQYGDLATDQLLNAIYVSMNVPAEEGVDQERLTGLVLHHLTSS